MPSLPVREIVSLGCKYLVSALTDAFTFSLMFSGNNFTFGQGGKDADGNVTEGWGYYETICGGSGAGPSWAGISGVHVSVTRIDIHLGVRSVTDGPLISLRSI
jgi:N-methylhydantoinase B/oxoprolinase/acetone carboxylase alpha subunit